MDIMELGAIGELVGGVAVIGSLIFVGFQVRHNSVLTEQTGRIAGATMLQETNKSYADFFRLIAASPELASIYSKGRRGEPLDPIEVARYESLLQVHFAWLEVNYSQQKLALRDEIGGFDVLELVGPFSRKLLAASYAREWWERDAAYQYTPSFYQDATRILLDGRGA